jgi:DNA-binding MarR family transcriptional regulator
VGVGRVQLPPHPKLVCYTAYLAIELGVQVREAVDRELREVGLTWPEFLVVRVIDAVGALPQEAICDRTAVDRSTVSAICRDFELDGLIERQRDPLDRRRSLCATTAGCTAAVEEAGQAVELAARQVLRQLHAKERARLEVLLGRALGALGAPAARPA